MDDELRRAIIIDNYENPFNKKEINDDEYIKVRTKSDSCIDDVTMYVKVKDNIITDAYFSGEACAISTSATSIFIKKIIGMSLNEVKNIMENYNHMINEETYDETILGELNAYSEIYKQANRKKCALVPVDTMQKIINEIKD